MPITSTACSPAVELILQFIKAGNKQAASTPGFGHALKLSYNLISKKHLTWTEADTATGPRTNSDTTGTLTYRYKFTENIGRPTSGLLLAIMDELTTDACFGAGKPSAPGVSLQMHLELCHGMKHPVRLSEARHLQELDVVSTVVKLGRTISYTKTDFINPKNQELVAFGSHAKYMPTGNVVMDLVFNQRWAWDLYCKLFVSSNSQLPIQYEEKDLYKSVIAPNLEHKGIGLATFRMNNEHVNPFGGLHVSYCCCLLNVLRLLSAVIILISDMSLSLTLIS